MPHFLTILFLFALGACVGSFLNVVVWRLPRGESVVSPPSHCPKCNNHLPWYDNIPILGWIKLGGKCRFCRQPISIRYPTVEFITAALFVFYYVMFYIVHVGPCLPPKPPEIFSRCLPLIFADHWPIYALYIFMIASLLAASLIDAELFIIPAEIPWLMAVVGIVGHALAASPKLAGSLVLSAPSAGLAAGAGLGLVLSIILLKVKALPLSFPLGDPLFEHEVEEAKAEFNAAKKRGENPPPLPPVYSRKDVRAEMAKEMLFMLPPLMLGAVFLAMLMTFPSLARWWEDVVRPMWVKGALGAIHGALVGAVIVWVTRIFGTLGFGKVAMGMGDVHLMFGVGAIIGAGASAVAFFLAPFFGILVAIYLLITRKQREIPYGPYLALATAFVILAYGPISDQIRPGLEGLAQMIGEMIGR